MVDLSKPEEALSPEELTEFLKDYKQHGRNGFKAEIDLGDNVDSGIRDIVNKLSQNVDGLVNRLVLTIIELKERKLLNHSGDCTRYASLITQTPESGICTCGYGLQQMRETGNNSELYSGELRDRLGGRL